MSVTKRETSETSIRVELKAGGGITKTETGNGFLDHMLNAFARYSGLTLDVKASSDLKHHLVEDVALTLGRAFREIIPVGAARYGNRVVPMDDALRLVAKLPEGGIISHVATFECSRAIRCSSSANKVSCTAAAECVDQNLL